MILSLSLATPSFNIYKTTGSLSLTTPGVINSACILATFNKNLQKSNASGPSYALSHSLHMANLK